MFFKFQKFTGSVSKEVILVSFFEFLITHSINLWEPPTLAAQGDMNKYIASLSKGNFKNSRATLILSNPTGLGRRCLQLTSTIYSKFAQSQPVVHQQVAIKILEELSKGLAKCTDPTTWRVIAETTLTVLNSTIPVVKQNKREMIELQRRSRNNTSLADQIPFHQLFWQVVLEVCKGWLGNLSFSLDKESNPAQHQQVLIELDRRLIEWDFYEIICNFNPRRSSCL